MYTIAFCLATQGPGGEQQLFNTQLSRIVNYLMTAYAFASKVPLLCTSLNSNLAQVEDLREFNSTSIKRNNR